jgi:hypothetical protein
MHSSGDDDNDNDQAKKQKDFILKNIKEQFNKGNEISAVFMKNLQRRNDKALRRIRKAKHKEKTEPQAIAIQPEVKVEDNVYMDIDPNVSSDDDINDRTDELLKNYNQEKDFITALAIEPKSTFYTRTDWFILIRKLLIRNKLLQPNKLFYWEIWIPTFALVGDLISFFLDDTAQFSKKASETVKQFWITEFVSLCATWIGLHYCTTYVKSDIKPKSIASTLNERRLICIKLASTLRECNAEFEKMDIEYDIQNVNRQETNVEKGNIFNQFNDDSEDILNLLTIAEAVSEEQQYWIEELEKLNNDIFFDTLYPNQDELDSDALDSATSVYLIGKNKSNIVKYWTNIIAKLDFVSMKLFLDEQYLDKDNPNSFKLFEIYTRLIHWISIQLYYLQKNTLYHVTFDQATHKLTKTTLDEYLEVKQEGSAINELRNLVYEYHLTAGSVYYYYHRHPDIFISYFNKNIHDLAIPGASGVMGDTNKKHIVEFLNYVYMTTSTEFRAIYTNKAHFYNDILMLQLFNDFMKRYRVDNWAETYIITNYKLSTHKHWLLGKIFQNRQKFYVRLPMIYFSFGIWFVTAYDFEDNKHRTFICTDCKHALLTWLWCVTHYNNNKLEDAICLQMTTITKEFLSEFDMDHVNKKDSISIFNNGSRRIMYNESHFSNTKLWDRFKKTILYKIDNTKQIRNAQQTIIDYRDQQDKEKKEKMKLDQPYKELKRQEKREEIRNIKEKEYSITLRHPDNIHNSKYARDLKLNNGKKIVEEQKREDVLKKMLNSTTVEDVFMEDISAPPIISTMKEKLSIHSIKKKYSSILRDKI